MRKRPKHNPEHPFTARKLRERALLLPLIGLVMLMPPIANIFQLDGRVLGIPFTLLYLFVVWALLIVAAARLSKRLLDQRDDVSASSSEPTD